VISERLLPFAEVHRVGRFRACVMTHTRRARG
jgi:hypothetical protein